MVEVRKNARLTQIAVAKQLGISQSLYSLIERNKRPLKVSMLKQLSKLFNIDESELLKQIEES